MTPALIEIHRISTAGVQSLTIASSWLHVSFMTRVSPVRTLTSAVRPALGLTET